MRLAILVNFLALVLNTLSVVAFGEPGGYEAAVASEILPLRTGPGRQYPITQIFEKGDQVQLLRQRTDWVYVSSQSGLAGWVSSADLKKLTNPEGVRLGIPFAGRMPESDYYDVALAAGDFGGNQAIGMGLSYSFTRNILLRGQLNHAIGTNSTLYLLGGDVLHLSKPFGDYRLYFGLGIGRVFIETAANVVRAQDQDDDFYKAITGLQKEVSPRLFLRLEYGVYTVLRSQDENDEISEITLGVGTHF